MNTTQSAAEATHREPSRRFDTILTLLFLAYLALACLVLAPLLDVNEPKWFVIRVGGPILLGAVLLRDLARGRSLRPGPIGVLAIVFLALNVLSLLVAVNIGNGLTEISKLAGLVCTFAVASRLAEGRVARDRVLLMLVLIGAASSIYGIAQHFGRDFMAWQQHDEVPVSRGVSFFGHATFAGSVLIQILPIALGFLLARRAWAARAAAGIAAALMLYHLSFTGARMATVAFLLTLVGGGVWLWRQRRREVVHTTRGLPGLRLTIVAVILVLAGGGLIVRAWQTKHSDPFAIRQSSMALRIYHWETGSRMVYAHPVMGIGSGNYEIVSPKYWNRVEQMRAAHYGRWMQQAHNEYLQTAAELGLPGVAILLALFAYGLVLALDAASRAPSRSERFMALAMAVSIAAIGLDANVTFSLQAPGSAIVFWTMLGLIAGTHAGVSRGEHQIDGVQHVADAKRF